MGIPSDAKIYVAGHRGLAGSAIWRELVRRGFTNLIGRTHAELDLTRQAAVESFFESERPEYVFDAAAKVGGIKANNDAPAEFIHANIAIQTNLIHTSWKFDVKKLLFLGSSCIYPKFAEQPLKESYLLTGALEPTNEWYAVAKISGLKMCQAYNRQYGADFISAMPTNLYGPGSSYDPEKSHMLEAMIRRFHEAKIKKLPGVVCWGTGTPLRELLHSDDLASACVHLIEHYSGEEIVNLGYGSDVSIKEVAETVARIVGYEGDIGWDPSKPDGTPRKLLDSSKLFELGWRPNVSLEEGIARCYEEFRSMSAT